jgi:putative protease
MHDRAKAPELLAPAGDWDCARAAVENGADGIYFGLRSGLNARARAANFAPEELLELMTFLRRRGVKGFLALNTLVFPEELESAEATIRSAVAAGVDALIVQDLGLARLAHEICPALPLHASTQMTLSTAECIVAVESLGIRRVVLPRELSLEEIARIHRQTAVELEVFVHGALCIGYSGQCLASLALGGRSGNRGQCAQACRLKYELVADGLQQNKKYLFSPNDLAAYELLPELVAAGVTALKIEGRLKEAEYVAVVTGFYRRALDEAMAGRRTDFSPEEIAELEAVFSRGFSHGWLEGPNPPALVPGESSAKRGVLLGEVRGVRGGRVRVALSIGVRRGMGVVFEGDRDTDDEQGGRIYEIFPVGQVSNLSISVEQVSNLSKKKNDRLATCPTEVELAFRRDSLDFGKIASGQKIWITDDPQASKKRRQLAQTADARRRVPLNLTVEASPGKPLFIFGKTPTGASCKLESPESLLEAQKHPLDEETLREQFGRLGGSIYELRRLDAKIEGRPMIPFSELGKLRRAMIEQLDESLAKPVAKEVSPTLLVPRLRMSSVSGVTVRTALTPCPSPKGRGEIALYVLCRSLPQIEVAVECGVSGVIAEFRDDEEYGEAVRLARTKNCPIQLATLRIHRPGDLERFRRLESFRPDGILARNLAALAHFVEKKMPVVADFSLNAANELSVFELCRLGATRVTAAYDLNRQSIIKLLESVPPESIEVILHAHVPMFHTAHCLFCAELSTGRGPSDCGRPCRRHGVRVRDRLGVEHFLFADADCRNTLYHADTRDFLDMAPELLRIGVRHFRLELLEENSRQTQQRIKSMRQSLNART